MFSLNKNTPDDYRVHNERQCVAKMSFVSLDGT